jgi:hypothetical protein
VRCQGPRVTVVVVMRMLGLAALLIGNVCAQLSWQRQAVQLPLTPRTYSAVGYDQVLDFLVVFGGQDVTGASLGDTWVLDWYAGKRPGVVLSKTRRPDRGVAY